MLSLRKLKMSALHQNRASAISLSQITSPTRNICRTALTRKNGYLYSECGPLTHRSLGGQFRIQVLLKGRCLRTQQPTSKGWATSSSESRASFTQTCCLYADKDGHDRQLPLEITQEANLGECDTERSTSGSIHLIVGPMFAGKTTALLNRVEAEASAGRRVALVKSDKDTRYGLASIVSHDGRQMPCWAVSSLANFRSQIGEDEYAKLDLIGIDEAQFLKDLYSFCQVAADHDSKTLIVAGLDGDFQRNKFGSILDLVPLADSVIKLSSFCEICGKPASFTFRKTDHRNKEVIGGTDIYMPVCRQHYFSGKIAMEATRTVLDTHKFIPLQFDNEEKPTHSLHDQ